MYGRDIVSCRYLVGIPKAVVGDRYREIVAFAGIEEATHWPVNFYSSGIAVRVAFAVVKATRTAILVLDETLSQCDGSFLCGPLV